jgi:hypothetical protein
MAENAPANKPIKTGRLSAILLKNVVVAVT